MTDTDKKNLREPIAAWLAGHPDSTVADIAAGIEAESATGPFLARGPRLDPIGDEWDVQHQLLFMVNRDIVQQVGKRETEQGLRPIYRMKNHGDRY